MNLLKKLAGQTAIYGLGSVIARLLNFLLVPLYTRYFLPEEYGVVTEMYAYVAFLVVFLTYGLETAFFRYTAKEKNKERVYSTSLISLIFTSIIFVLIIFLNADYIANLLQYANNPEYIKWFALIVGIDAICSISFAKLRQQDRANRFTLVRLVNIFINIGLNLFFIIYCPYALENNLSSVEFVNSIYSKNIGIGYIFIANLIASFFTLLMLMPEMIKSIWVFDIKLWKKMIVYAIPLLFAGLAGITNETIDRVLLKQLLPKSVNVLREVGIYGAFYKLSILMTLFVQTFRFAAEPFFFAHEKEHNSRKTYASVMKYFVLIMAIIFLFVTTYYNFVVQFLGEEFRGDERGFKIVSILLLANFFLGIYYNLSIWFKLSEKTKYGAFISIFGAITTIFLNIILIPLIGIVGSAWATLICYFLMVICSYFLGKKHYPIPYEIKKIGIYFIFMMTIYMVSQLFNFGMLINTTYIIFFLSVIIILEKPKKSVISNPKLFN